MQDRNPLFKNRISTWVLRGPQQVGLKIPRPFKFYLRAGNISLLKKNIFTHSLYFYKRAKKLVLKIGILVKAHIKNRFLGRLPHWALFKIGSIECNSVKIKKRFTPIDLHRHTP